MEYERTRSLSYLAPRDMRKNRADSVHMMCTCHGFAELGVKTELVTPRVLRKNWSVQKNEIWDQYGIDPNFSIRELPMFFHEDYFPAWLSRVQQFFSLLLYLCVIRFTRLRTRERQHAHVFYSKCYTSSFAVILFAKLTFLDVRHYFEKPDFNPRSWLHRFVCTSVSGVVATNPTVLEKVKTVYGIQDYRLTLKPLYCHIRLLEPKRICQKDARINLDLPSKPFIVGYGGKMGWPRPEMQLLLETAQITPQFHFIFIGAKDEVKTEMELFCEANEITNVTIRGFQNLETMFHYALAADVLVGYYPKSDWTANYVNPAKMQVYLCASRPIVLPSLPNLQFLFSDQFVSFVEPEQPKLLSQELIAIHDDPKRADAMGRSAIAYAERHDVFMNCRFILDFVEQSTEWGNKY